MWQRILSLLGTYIDVDGVLVVSGGGEDITLLGRNDRVPLDHLLHYSSLNSEAKRQRTHIQQDDSLCLVLAS